MASFNSAVFCAGGYSATYNSVAMGLFMGDAQSPTIELITKTQPIDSTDAYGRMTIGGIHQGSDAIFQAIMLEWLSSTKTALWPYGNLGVAGTVGVDQYNGAQSLVLTAITGGLAATVGPTAITASKAYLAPNFSPRLLLGPVLREMPIRLQLFPYISTVPVHFTTTG